MFQCRLLLKISPRQRQSGCPLSLLQTRFNLLPTFQHFPTRCLHDVERVDHLPIIRPGSSPYKKKKTKDEKRRLREKREKSLRPSYRFIDRLRLRAVGGVGGVGGLSKQHLARKRHFVPDGGHGGNGGNVLVIADARCTSLGGFKHHVAAEKGTRGRNKQRNGARGKNTLVRVPPGVVVKRILDDGDVWDEENKTVVRPIEREDEEDDQNWDVEYPRHPENETAGELGCEDDWNEDRGEEYGDEEEGKEDFGKNEDEEDVHRKRKLRESESDYDEYDTDEDDVKVDRRVVTVADLDKPGSYAIVARGGRGGRGNCIYARRHGAIPNEVFLHKRAQPHEGEIAFLELELKLIADLGLVGFPNAGKSSLLSAMSAATPEIAAYPFTTLHPLIGCIEYRDGYRVVAADIPGLIDGASEGRGKGFDFLKHIERTKALLYIVDAASVDFRDPIADLKTLANELASYGDGSLMERNVLVVGNKTDLMHEDQVAEMQISLQETALEVGLNLNHDSLMISAGVSGAGLKELSKAIRAVVESSEKQNMEESA